MTGLSKLLESANYHVFATTLGREALHLAKEHSPDAVLLDVMMPDISGKDIVRVLQDSVVAREELRALGVAAQLDGDSAFTFGLLHGLEQGRAAAALAGFDRAWRKVRRRRLT